MSEILTLDKRVAGRTVTVTVALEGATYVVATSTGYRATLPACPRDECERGLIKSCTRSLDSRGQHSDQSVNAWLSHCKWHCHGWHRPRVETFAKTVLATYTPARKPAAASTVKPNRAAEVDMDALAKALKGISYKVGADGSVAFS